MSKIKSILAKIAPLRRDELVKFVCVSTLIILIVYVHDILRIAKDALVMSHLGTEYISAIKIWAVLPVSLIFMFLYIKLSDVFSRAKLFHIMNWFLISYFVLFALVLYPNSDAICIHISDHLYTSLPTFKYFFNIVKNWHYCLFYAFAEGWVMIMLSISFWQTANHITTLDESKRIYPLLGFASHAGLMIAAILSKVYVVSGTNWQPTLNKSVISIVVAGACISVCLFILEKKIIGSEFFNLKKGHFRGKRKISIKESIEYVAKSKPILLITILLLCFNLSLTLIEGVWKKSIELLCNNNANLIQNFLGNINMYIPLVGFICTVLSVYILQTHRWRMSALITPIAVLLTGGVFFVFMLLREYSYVMALQASALSIGTLFGSINNIFARGAKYTLFDSTKEMIYIPLDDDLQIKGKAAAETVGMKFGKGAGAALQQTLLALFPTLTLIDLSPIISIAFFAILAWWIYSITISSRRLLPDIFFKK